MGMQILKYCWDNSMTLFFVPHQVRMSINFICNEGTYKVKYVGQKLSMFLLDKVGTPSFVQLSNIFMFSEIFWGKYLWKTKKKRKNSFILCPTPQKITKEL